jgi:hypothetical protein
MRERVILLLPFLQVVIALVTLARLPEPPPQYFCQLVDKNLIVCNPDSTVWQTTVYEPRELTLETSVERKSRENVNPWISQRKY